MKFRALIFGLSFAASAALHAAPVIGIADGDTLTVLEDQKPRKIRLANIDAPERKQDFGEKSRQSLSQLCFKKDATYQVQDTDRYGRTVAVVKCDGVEANRTQVMRGFAWVYRRYNKDPSLHQMEAAAKKHRAGLWSHPSPVPPWEFRRKPKGKPGESAEVDPGH
jgi:micrococcal nuclease